MVGEIEGDVIGVEIAVDLELGVGSNPKVLSIEVKEGGLSGFKEVGDGGAIGSEGSVSDRQMGQTSPGSSSS